MHIKNSFLTTAVFVVGFIAFGMTTENKLDQIKRNENKQLNYVGTANRKSYFADNGSKNWTDARELCELNGMHLATITSTAQWNLLISAYNGATFSGNFWTALRDAHLPRQFTWDSLEIEPSTDIGIRWGNFDGSINEDYHNCATFHIVSDAYGMYINPCSFKMRVLCET